MELVALMPLVAQVPAEKPKERAVRHSRLEVEKAPDGKELVTLGDKPFTGVAFWEESWGRAEVTYSNGIPDGEVTVVSRNRLLYQFRYDKGRKVTNSVTSGTSSTSGAGAGLDAGEGEGGR